MDLENLMIWVSKSPLEVDINLDEKQQKTLKIFNWKNMSFGYGRCKFLMFLFPNYKINDYSLNFRLEKYSDSKNWLENVHNFAQDL